jgi:DNA recombination protein RmuC
MITTVLLFVALAMLVALGFMVFLLLERLRDFKDSQAGDKSLLLINQNMQGLGERLDKTTEAINTRLDKAAQFIASVQKEMGTVGERFKRFEEFNDLLHPKLRGLIGERIMSDMLSQTFPAAQFDEQYRFKNGEIVDAIIRTKAGILPVDSKFPLDNFQQIANAPTDADRAAATKSFAKAVKKHIDDIATKYILPEEGTVNFAVMYVPSENIYYQMVTDDEGALLEYAKKKGVLVTSPNGFFFMMRIVYMSLERERMQEQALKIWEILKGLQHENIRFRGDLDLVARHIGNAKSAMDTAYKGYDRLTAKMERVRLLEGEAEPPDRETAENS